MQWVVNISSLKAASKIHRPTLHSSPQADFSCYSTCMKSGPVERLRRLVGFRPSYWLIAPSDGATVNRISLEIFQNRFQEENNSRSKIAGPNKTCASLKVWPDMSVVVMKI